MIKACTRVVLGAGKKYSGLGWALELVEVKDWLSASGEVNQGM